MTDFANMRILADDLILAATLGASPALVSTLPAAHLKTTDRAAVARSTSTASQTLTGNFTATGAVSCVVLWRHNLTDAATWKVELFTAVNQGGTKVYDSGDVDALTAPAIGYWVAASPGVALEPAQYSVLYFGSVNARSFRITLDDAANPDGYVQACRLMMGAYWEPSQNPDRGPELQWLDASSQWRSGGGTLRTDPRCQYRQLTLDFSVLSLADMADLQYLIARVGLRSEVWVSVLPGWGALDSSYLRAEVLQSFVGKLAAPNSSRERTFARYSDRLVIQET